MKFFSSKLIFLASATLVPLLTISSPSWFAIAGVSPAWSVLWLLPWALIAGPISGLFAGFCLGLTLDALTVAGNTFIPALVLLGWWWGRLGEEAPRMERSFNLGLLAWVGAGFLGLLNICQLLLAQVFRS